MKAFLLSAGLGTRLRPHTEKVAKPALPFLQVPMLGYSAELLLRMGATELVFNLHHQPNSVQSAVEGGPLKKFLAGYSLEENLLGSGGGLLQAADQLGDGPWIMANADEVFIPENPEVLNEVLTAHRKAGSFATLVVQSHPLAGTTYGAVWVSEEGKVLGFGRQKIAGSNPWHYLGYLVVESEIQRFLPSPPRESNILYDGLARAIDAGRPVRIYRAPGFWQETGNIESYIDATATALEILPRSDYLHSLRQRWGLEPSPLEHSPSGATILWGEGSTLESKSLIKNFLVLGKNVQIGPQVALNQVVVADHLKVTGPAQLQATLLLEGS